MALEICGYCGKTFETKYGFICSKCRKKLLSDLAKKRNLSKIGREAYSKKAKERRDEK